MTLASNLIAFSCLPAVVVLAIVLGNVAAQTAGSHALWRLGGATPRQVVLVIILQSIAVNLLATSVGVVLALLGQQHLNDALLSAGSPGAASLPAAFSPLALMGTSAVLVVLAVLAAVLPAIRAAGVSPMVARRSTDQAVRPRGRQLLLSITFFVVVVLPISATIWAIPSLGNPVFAVIATLPLGQVLAVQTAMLAPWLLPPLVRGWTAAVPVRSTSWRVARHLALENITTSSAIVAPLMLATALFSTMLTITATAGSVAGGTAGQVNSFEAVLITLPIGILGTVGSVAVVLMAARSRTRDVVALRAATVGRATANGILALEALVGVISAALLSLVPLGIQVTLLTYALAVFDRPPTTIRLMLGPSLALLCAGLAGSLVVALASGQTPWRRPLAVLLREV